MRSPAVQVPPADSTGASATRTGSRSPATGTRQIAPRAKYARDEPSGEKNGEHEFYLMCDDVNAFVAEMKTKNFSCGEVQDMGWGVLTQLTLPGGGKLGVYQPRHARPEPMK